MPKSKAHFGHQSGLKFALLSAASIIALAIIGGVKLSARIVAEVDIVSVASATQMSVATTSACAVDGARQRSGECFMKGLERRNALTV